MPFTQPETAVMKENVLDVLMYLFENYIDDDIEQEPDRDALAQSLIEAGFPKREIEKAFNWLEDLVEQNPAQSQGGTTQAIRIYADVEMARLDTECRGFLLFLEQQAVLNPALREMVIDRVMALEADEIDLEQLKWVVLMVLFNHPMDDPAHIWLENAMLEYDGAPLH